MTTFFHCIPEGCGQVFYRPYLAPVVRWRYPGEDWQEIEGDDYTIEQLPAQCCGSWDITVEYYVPGCNGARTYSGARTVRIPYGKYRRLEYQLDNPFVRTNIAVIYWDCRQNKEKTLFIWSSTGKSSVIPNCGDPAAIHNQVDSTYQVTDVNRVDEAEENCNKCSLVIYKKQQIVHSEVKSECPEVEVSSCRLSDVVKEIKIEKEAYLQRIEVRNQSIGVTYLPGFGTPVLDVNQLPQECLNIYNTYTLAAPILIDEFDVPGVINPYIFVAQICSAPGCPPPEYEVICGCDSCEFCPPDTCPVLCHGVICCHEKTTGKAIKSIPVDQYCGEIN